MMTTKMIQTHLVRSRKNQNGPLNRFAERNPRSEADTPTLRNPRKILHYNSSESLDKLFTRVRVEKITIPRVNGRSLYAFIEISWALRTLVKTSDLCIMHNSGKVQVNSRPIYLHEFRDKSAKK